LGTMNSWKSAAPHRNTSCFFIHKDNQKGIERCDFSIFATLWNKLMVTVRVAHFWKTFRNQWSTKSTTGLQGQPRLWFFLSSSCSPNVRCNGLACSSAEGRWSEYSNPKKIPMFFRSGGSRGLS
jgi:hypothetical protein